MKPKSGPRTIAAVCVTAVLLLAVVLLILHGNAAKQQDENTSEVQETMAAIQIQTITTDSFSMDYFRFGQGERTLVILPGLSVQSVMGSADAVASAYQSLTEEFTIYLFDHRKDLPAAYSVADMARDTDAAIRALGLDEVCLFGASQGGMIAMQIAADDPGLVRKMVLASTTAQMTEERYQTIGGWVSLASSGDREGLYLSFGEALYPTELYEQSKELLIGAAQTVTAEELARFIILAQGMQHFNATNDLDRLACPVLVVGSKDNQVLGADASVQISELLASHPDAELYLYEDYGHALYDTAPDFQERMLRFLTAE